MRAFDDQRIDATIKLPWSRDMISGRGQPQKFSRTLRTLLLYTQPPLSVNPGYAPGVPQPQLPRMILGQAMAHTDWNPEFDSEQLGLPFPGILG